MPSKDSNFISINIPRYLIRDIDDFMILVNRRNSRASFIVNILNDYLDTQAYGNETNKKGKKIIFSPRAERCDIHIQLSNPTLSKQEEKKLIERHKELNKEIEKE